jgi:hypothetical protein
MLERFKRLWVVWKGVGHKIVHGQNVLLLLIVFVFGMLPSAIFVRFQRLRLLDREAPDPDSASYWTSVPETKRDMDWAQRPY